MPTPDADNRPRWRPGRPGRFEAWYFKLNDAATGNALWLRHTIRAPMTGAAVAEVWGVWFDAADPARSFALKATRPVAELGLGRDAFAFRLGSSSLTTGAARGSLTGSAGTLLWHLDWRPAPRSFRPYPFGLLYHTRRPPTKFLVPNLDVRASGTITVNGRLHPVRDAPAEQGHLWGTRHAPTWAWAHANAFRGAPGVVLELLTATPQAGAPPSSLVFLRTPEGDRLWNRPWGTRFESAYDVGRWSFAATRKDERLEVELAAPAERFVGLTYHDPDGSTRVCHNTKLADAMVRLRRGRELVAEYSAERSAAFEVVQAEADPRVRVHLT